MKALIQRVGAAKVEVEGKTVGQINKGIVTLLGIAPTDTEKDLEWMIGKIIRLRIFDDADGKMNLSLTDVAGEHLIVSQFTLYGDTKKGNRPSFVGAAPPEQANKLYQRALEMSRALGIKTESGQFQAHMQVSLVNDGPVTLMIESPQPI